MASEKRYVPGPVPALSRNRFFDVFMLVFSSEYTRIAKGVYSYTQVSIPVYSREYTSNSRVREYTGILTEYTGLPTQQPQ